VNRIKTPAELAASYELVIIGAGPAGMSAAVAAAECGVHALVVDENPAPGGQIYRAVTTGPQGLGAVLGAEYRRGAALVEAFSRASVEYMPGATVWSANPIGQGGDFEIGVSLHGEAAMIDAQHVILAGGAMERPFCIPGWTLPGVMTAGAAQIALKASGLVPEGRVVLAGCGPLLLLIASQLRAAGANIVAFLDTTERNARRRAAPLLPAFLRSPYAHKGFSLLSEARRCGRLIRGVTALRVEGEERVRRIVAAQGGDSHAIECDTVLLHHGVIPAITMPDAIGCARHFDTHQHCWVPEVDEWFASSVEGVSIAGDAAGIGGAESAAQRGTLAALGAARRLGRISEADCAAAAARPRRAHARAMRGRRFLDLLYRPSRAFLAPDAADAIACRCEEVTVGQIREAASRLGVPGPNQMKAFLRCGMGPCQGRLCGPTVAEIMADIRGVSMAEIGTYRSRPPFKPVTVGELAALPKTEAAIKAVIR
jgi:NADPH-dependent 2,4-dienoyl-CoA reductase/sulfur reductase-like enzyme